MSVTRSPGVQWAQRADKLYLNIDVQDSKDPEVKLDNDEGQKAGKLTFRGMATSHATGALKACSFITRYKPIKRPDNRSTRRRNLARSAHCKLGWVRVCRVLATGAAAICNAKQLQSN